jgi:hypothetical protein
MTPTSSEDELLHLLRCGPLYAFADWPILALPRGAAGVYSIWEGEVLQYVGMSGRAAASAAHVRSSSAVGKPWGLATRLASHASGRRSGDRFCVYVSDYLVLPTLSPADIQRIASRQVLLDDLIRSYIRSRLSFRVVQTVSGSDAHRLELAARSGALGLLPRLNAAL